MSPTSSVSPENIASAPISQPKNLQEFGKMLDQEKSHISKEDYDAILLSLSSKQDTLKNNADRIGFEAQFTPIFLKDQIAALESAIRKEKAAKFNEKTNDLQKPAIQAAAQGDVKATKALAEVAKAQKPVDKQKAVETSEIVATTKVEVAKAKKDVVKTSVENTLPKQAESLIQYIETVSPILRGSDIISDMKSKLSDTNIRSLVSHLATGSVYVSDGAYGILGERWMVGRMQEEFKKNPDFKAAIIAAYPITKSGVSADLATRDFKLKNNVTATPESIISYLGNLHANAGDKVDGKGSATAMSGNLITQTLSKAQKKGNLVEYVNQSIVLSGANVEPIKNIDDLAAHLKTNESLKYSIIDGMNMLWSMQELPGIQEGVSSREKEQIQKISEKLKAAVDVSRAKALEWATTPEDRKAVEIAYKDLLNQVSRSDIQYGFGVMLSNKGLGAGVGFEKWINDENSLIVNAGLLAGKPVFDLGIKHEFMKTQNSQLSGKAGLMLAPGFTIPFVEGVYSVDTWTASLRLTPIGGMATVSKELGNTGEVLGWMESFKQKSPELADQLLKFSDVKTQASEVNFSRNTNNVSQEDLPGFKAVSADMNQMIQKVLILKKYDTVTNPHERYAMLVSAMMQVVQERQYRVQRDAATNGVSVNSAGVALGVFDTIPFIFPFLGFGAGILDHADVQKETTHKKTDKLSAESLQKKYLTQAPERVMGTDGTLQQIKYTFKPGVIKLSDTTVKIAEGAKVTLDPLANSVTFGAQPKISIVNGVLELSTVGEFSKATLASTTQTLTAEQVRSMSEARNKVSPELSHLLFYIGHSEEKAFRDIIQKISRQDFDGAKTLVEKLQKGKYKTLATSILSAWNSVASFPTHMYGSKNSRAKQEFTQKFVDLHVRKQDTVRAETRLAQQNGVTQASPEAALKLNAWEKYTAQSTAEMFPGQEMTISCFSTPKNGLHRVDTYDASVSISKKKVEITDLTYRAQIVESTLKNVGPDSKGISGQLKKLNEFLKNNGETQAVTLDQYKKYLITGNILELGVAKLTAPKAPKFFEGRALIAGNVCVNRLHGIIYPTFELNGVPQGVVPPSTIDITETEVSTTSEVVGGVASYTPVNVTLGVGFVGDKPETPKPPATGGVTTDGGSTPGTVTEPVTWPVNGPGTTVIDTTTPPTPGGGNVTVPTTPGGNTGILGGLK